MVLVEVRLSICTLYDVFSLMYNRNNSKNTQLITESAILFQAHTQTFRQRYGLFILCLVIDHSGESQIVNKCHTGTVTDALADETMPERWHLAENVNTLQHL